MIRTIKKVTSILMSCVMAAVILGGCGAKDQPSDNGAAPTAAPTTGVEPSAAAAPEDNTVSYPVDTDQTLTVWSATYLKPQDVYTDYTQSPFHTGLAKHTGIDVEWEFAAAGTEDRQAYNLMMTSGTLPDIILAWTITDGDAERLIEEGTIYDLTELLPKYAPNYWNYLQASEYNDRAFKTDEGRYWGFGSFRESEWAATYVGPVIRKDWLDALNLEVPVTIADWDAVIKAFKQAYGATFAYANNRMSPGIASGFDAFSSFETGLYIDDNQKVQLSNTQPEWKAYMSQMNQWFSQGLIDQDIMTLDDAGMRTKVLNNQVGISVTAMSQITNWMLDAQKEGTGAQWIGIPYPVPNAGDIAKKIQMEDTIQGFSAVISTDCPEDKLELALRWLDYAFSEEGFLYWNYGDEGVSYTMVDGKPVFTELVTNDPVGLDKAIRKYNGSSGRGIGVQAMDMVKQKNDPAAAAAVDIWLSNQESQKHFYPAGTTMTVDESNEFTNIFTPIQTLVKEMSLKFMVGDESLDNFDAFVTKLKGMGLDRALEIKQAAYDRYLAR